ncbi:MULTISPECIES: UDP-glucose dehydrogenase family protein [Paenibacillus]|uniref:UDP-glucose 6-dehydrogenase n=1 Tax=Paenibacillus campinasensis TaxID=66347 RepID=A0A268F237_9BACL|nr:MULTISPECIES: UDP-glucose/GDP-mannose dehydrogenase family protein [Paenibacillus]PAD79448.1 UDP-glucose 6-dehydrogenase [Paenibacillus campinasensis]PAK51767.1 UDP-glucose 6-dehydrogenase [Paenibacillus sp. 7541]
MQITVVGTGYVGLVTGVTFAEIGHEVICTDVDSAKIMKLSRGEVPFYEPGLQQLMVRNLQNGRLRFTTDTTDAYRFRDVICIAVGTPSRPDGAVDVSYIEQAVLEVAKAIEQYTVIVVKSTVPVGTNEQVRAMVQQHTNCPFDIVSNPEFLREGSAIHDIYHGDRIVIGADSDRAADIVTELHKPFGTPVFRTDPRSAELIKYASNAFLATKISYINEMANLCEKLGANVDAVAHGMGLDRRIGSPFLQAGLGYGGSCFPKDIRALLHMAESAQSELQLLRAVSIVNEQRPYVVLDKLKQRFSSLRNLRVAILGLSFKPNTDDIREAVSLVMMKELLKAGASLIVYDPIVNQAKGNPVLESARFAGSMKEALDWAEASIIVTEWDEIRSFPLLQYNQETLKETIIFDGRNCYALAEAERAGVEYYSIGRPAVNERQPSHLLHS